MKKIFAQLAVISLLIFVILSACQSADHPQQGLAATVTQSTSGAKTALPSPTLTPTATPLPDWYIDENDLQDVQLTFYHPWNGDVSRQMDILVDTFNQTNSWGIFVEVSDLGGSQQVFQHTENEIQAGDPPNVVIAPVEELAYWADQESVVVLDDFLNDSTYGMDTVTQAAYFPLFWEQDVVNGERLGIPAARSARLLTYNYTWAQELGFSVAPQTTIQFKNQVCAAQQALLNDNQWQNDGLGGMIVDRNEYTILSWLTGFGIDPYEGQPVYPFNQDQTKAAFVYLRALFDEGCAWNARNPTPFEYFANREALMYSTTVEELLDQTQAMELAENEDGWKVIPFPAADGEPGLVVYGPSYAIIDNTPEENLASWLFIRWMNQSIHLKQVSNALGSYPVTTELLNSVAASRSTQWRTAVDLLETARIAPQDSWWRVGRFVLPDAVYQIYGVSFEEDQLTGLLTLLDETIESLNSQPASSGWN